MIESIAGLTSYALLLGFATVVFAAVFWIARVVRSRRPTAPAPTRTLLPTMSPDDPANLDSSHVGGPLLERTVDPNIRFPGQITKGGGL